MLAEAVRKSVRTAFNLNRLEQMFTAILVGLIVGAVAKLLMPGKDPGGIIITILIGIAGAVVGTFIGRALGFYGTNEAAGIIVSVIGAMILLWLYRVLLRRRAVP